MGYQSNRASDKPSNGLDSSRGIGSSLTETDALANGLASGQAAGAHLQEAVHDPRWMWAAVVFLLISTLIRLAQPRGVRVTEEDRHVGGHPHLFPVTHLHPLIPDIPCA